MAGLLASTPVVGELGQLFADAGHELYLVGGPVRDALLGVLQHDLDFTTSARPDDIEKLLRGWTKAVWDIGKEYGTIGAKKRSQGVDWQIEITTFRADSYRSDSRKPEVNFGSNIADDLIRRDFTVNAMAFDVANNRFVDPYGGLQDLANRVLRTPFTAERSFSDDPLRMMRAARFASQLQFSVAPDVQQAMTEMADRIQIISAERVHDELCKLLLTDHPRPGLNLLVTTGLADRVLPELSALRQTQDEHKRHKDVYQHSLTVLDQAIALERERGHQPDLVLRLAALLHDIGKPATRVFEDDGSVSFHHHDLVGAKQAKKRMKTLKFSTDDTKAVCQLIEQHLRFHGYGEAQWSDSAVRRYVRDAGDQLERLHILTRSDCTTRNQRKAARLRAAYDDLEQRIQQLAEQEELDAMRPDLDGEQIMQLLGLKPSREVGEAYKYLLNLRIDEGPLGEEKATEALLQWWQQRQAQQGN
ncbi:MULTISPECIES: CCA tRNA nucleotidyltransferase [unclassified Luteococcus]|uniref:CCA tRNA nucleotidyltransferase n=1 Tax=unclassified Luteococcus TaxID=2639923 RepID=UPI00313B12A5